MSVDIVDRYASRLSRDWYVRLRTDNGIQIVKPKRANMLGVWSGLFLLPFWGFGLIIWLLVVIDYIFQREKVIFVSMSQMTEQLKSEVN